MRVADPSAQARFDEQTRAKEAEKAAKEAEKARAMGCLPLVVAPLLLAAFVGSLSRDVVGGSDALVVAFYALVGGFVLYLFAYMQGQSDRRQQESDERRQPAAVRPARPDDDPYQ